MFGRSVIRYVSWYLVVAMFVIGIAPRAEAGLSPSEAVSLLGVDRGADLDKVQKFLEMKMVRERLEKLGYKADEIQSRLGELSDVQLHELALNIDQLNVGGDDLGVVIALLIIVILVIIIIQLTGHRVIVTK
jgi:hypothetical protein